MEFNERSIIHAAGTDMRIAMKGLSGTVAAGIALALAACQTTGGTFKSPEERAREEEAVRILSEGRPSELAPYYRTVIAEGKRNAVLNWLRTGKAALDGGYDEAAAEAFDEALAGIEEIYADNPEAEKARSVWHAESAKDFKGEPYERAMAYYYRGLLYMKAGDYENARASFKGAQIQDSFAEDERFRQDFAVAAWLDGWASHCLGQQSLAEEAFREAASLREGLKAPDPGDDLLVLAEAGLGPSKEAYGQYREKLAYREGMVLRTDLVARTSAKAEPMVVAEDLFFQATTRGGREMDKVLALKADTKLATNSIGAGVAAAGAGVMVSGSYNNDSSATAAGAMIMLAGLIAQAAAQSMNPEADTRYWDDLPHSILLASLKAGQAAQTAEVTFSNGVSAILSPYRIQRSLGRGCSLMWLPTSAVRHSPPVTISPAAGVATPERASGGT
jgi:tetratricopeptide (TPR) repeat protein